jgi:hypothetical protein
LLDLLTGVRALHLRPAAPLPVVERGAIETLYTFPDPAAVARDLLQAAQAVR